MFFRKCNSCFSLNNGKNDEKIEENRKWGGGELIRTGMSSYEGLFFCG